MTSSRFVMDIRSVLHLLLFELISLLLLSAQALGVGEVLFAVNCGGEAHIDSFGVKYQKDYLSVGISSDYGKSLLIQRVDPRDQILYQTERYHTSTFGYDLPAKDDGDYVLVLKFSEVWFTASNQKVFDVMLNGRHTVTDGLDIYHRVGRGTAHDEVIPFSVKNGELRIGDEHSQVLGGKIPVEFIKGEKDNPKINAVYMIKGTLDDVPKLPPIPGQDRSKFVEEEEEEEDADEEVAKPLKRRKPAGPRVQDPYASDDTSSMMLPVFVAIGTFIPILFCLCKL